MPREINGVGRFGGDGGAVGDSISAASLLFAAGQRPSAEAIGALAASGSGFNIAAAGMRTNEPPDPAAQEWVEIVAEGLTFDLVGLAPGPRAPWPPCVHGDLRPDYAEGHGLEAVALQPGAHIAAGHAMTPVVRGLATLAAALTQIAGVRAVGWHPARKWSAASPFRQGMQRWRDEGVFPATQLVALARAPDGGLQSEGLALFTGQELRLEPELTRDREEAEDLAAKLIDELVLSGSVSDRRRGSSADSAALRLEPSVNGRFVRVWRG